MLLDELRREYRYVFFELSRKDERSTTLFQAKGRRMTLTPAVAIKLVVPAKSALGKEILAMRKSKVKARR